MPETNEDRARRTLRERFDSRVNAHGPVPAHVDGIGACWLWEGARSNGGYGLIAIRRAGRASSALAHRVSYELYTGPIPPGMFVCHRCDNRSCVNPAHLFVGTPADNAADMVAKGRQPRVSGAANGTKTRPDRVVRGDDHGSSRLRSDDVRAIHRLRSDGVRVKEIAKRFGISKWHAYSIINGRYWSHLAPNAAHLPAKEKSE
jgi:hypothetical protein